MANSPTTCSASPSVCSSELSSPPSLMEGNQYRRGKCLVLRRTTDSEPQMLAVEPSRGETMLKNIRLDRPLVVLDLETTGKRVHADRIVEISTLKLFPDGSNKIYTRRINPCIPNGINLSVSPRRICTCGRFWRD